MEEDRQKLNLRTRDNDDALQTAKPPMEQRDQKPQLGRNYWTVPTAISRHSILQY